MIRHRMFLCLVVLIISHKYHTQICRPLSRPCWPHVASHSCVGAFIVLSTLSHFFGALLKASPDTTVKRLSANRPSCVDDFTRGHLKIEIHGSICFAPSAFLKETYVHLAFL